MATSSPLQPIPMLPRYFRDAQTKHSFVRGIFDQTAGDYDRVERLMALGTGSWYRRQALLRAGLGEGMRVLDVAIGTGLVAREEIAITQSPANVIGVDLSIGMLSQALAHLPIRGLLGNAERLPVGDRLFDFVSFGYALRHLADLGPAMREFFRVLKPGGRVCILEITRPRTRAREAALKFYMKRVVPLLTRLTTRHADSQLLWEYYWDSIEACVPPEGVLGALRAAGFTDVRRHVELGIFSEYTGAKPAGV
jgi:demethylmenaquinone methyltransferase/2-methoxy-6-polyprenyl-1,4-benzoquinol methylase